jgi:GT2 family glycosyltransferase
MTEGAATGNREIRSQPPRVTLGFLPRERFSWAARSLKNLLETPAGIDYRLVIVDCAIPERYRHEFEAVVAGRDDVEFIRLDHHVMPNESRHLVSEISTTEYTALLENDNYVAPNWLGALVEACDEFDATMAVPLIMERGRYHGDDHLGGFNFVQMPQGMRLQFDPIYGKHEEQSVLTVENAECHALVVRTEAARRLDLFDPELTSHDFLDITLKLFHAGEKLVFQPRSVINFHSPPGVDEEEREFFRRRWDLDLGFVSTNRVRERHGLAQIPSAKAFARERLHRESWVQLAVYTLQVRIWRRFRTLYRKFILRRQPMDLLEYVTGPVSDNSRHGATGDALKA